MPELSPLSVLVENKQVMVRHAGVEDWDKSRVEGLLGRHLQLGWPISEGRLLRYAADTRIEVGFSNQSSFFVFSVPILRTSKRPLPLLVVPRPHAEELLEFKRRTAPRVPALMPISYEVEGAEGEDHSLILSLSASGLAFNARHPITPKYRLQMEVHLPGATASLSFGGEVVQCGRVTNTPEERYKVRVKFLGMGEHTRDLLFHFVRDKERDMKVRGLD